MNGYIEAGYGVVLGSLGVYAATLLRREHLARARLKRPEPVPDGAPSDGPAGAPERSPR